ncbi:helix-turn-helix domain-containing protein [Sorangium cellulosum]|uniref:helix-turn-helix domain-containing protein n=1 Tax=Sorangium cellulosum TaxID=56 RepID=UPI0012DB6D5E|nr:helix-turn-helix transcriptional regulator [Sorangium cellulosum]
MPGSIEQAIARRAPRLEVVAPASRVLRNFVVAARAITPPIANIDLLPDGTTTLVFRLLDADRGDIVVLGPQTRALYKRVPRLLLAVQVVFRPGGAYPFFGVPMDELADRMVPARDLWGRRADALLEQLVAVGTGVTLDPTRARVEAIERALEDRVLGPDVFEPASAAVARAAVRKLSLGGVTVEETARALHVSPRNLRRAFAATVGVSPKQYARITRFQRVVSNVQVARGSWSEVALASGYCDQPHLVREFRELAGLSPVAFMKRRSTSEMERAR